MCKTKQLVYILLIINKPNKHHGCLQISINSKTETWRVIIEKALFKRKLIIELVIRVFITFYTIQR